MKRPKDISFTPGEWHVKLENNLEISSNHSSAFLQKCFAALEANRLYTGEGWNDQIWHQVCEQHPEIPCDDTERQEIVTGWMDVRRFFITLTDLIGSGRTLVEPEVQEKRIQTCLICPKNISLGACSSCSWVAGKLSELAGGRSIKDEPRVHRRGCGACKCEISVKTAYPLDVLKMVDSRLDTKPEYWDQCWMRE